jgi:hypothetical protein
VFAGIVVIALSILLVWSGLKDQHPGTMIRDLLRTGTVTK